MMIFIYYFVLPIVYYSYDDGGYVKFGKLYAICNYSTKEAADHDLRIAGFVGRPGYIFRYYHTVFFLI